MRSWLPDQTRLRSTCKHSRGAYVIVAAGLWHSTRLASPVLVEMRFSLNAVRGTLPNVSWHEDARHPEADGQDGSEDAVHDLECKLMRSTICTGKYNLPQAYEHRMVHQHEQKRWSSNMLVEIRLRAEAADA